jgi:hypothetical protein
MEKKKQEEDGDGDGEASEYTELAAILQQHERIVRQSARLADLLAGNRKKGKVWSWRVFAKKTASPFNNQVINC